MLGRPEHLALVAEVPQVDVTWGSWPLISCCLGKGVRGIKLPSVRARRWFSRGFHLRLLASNAIRSGLSNFRELPISQTTAVLSTSAISAARQRFGGSLTPTPPRGSLS